MKKLYAFLSVILMATTVSAVNVTFKVNMANETVSANGVHVAGNFDANGSSGTAWSPSAYTMTDANSDGIYEVTIDLNVGLYEFKFINDNDWPGAENVPMAAQVGGGNGNRWAYVAGMQDVGSICFGELVDCGKVGVTFQVNMSLQTVSALGVHVAGNMQGWDPAGTEMHNPDGGNVYKYIHEFTAMDSVQFKFVNGDDWPDAESVPAACEAGGNRFINGITADSMMTAVCYGACVECQTSNLTLRVDMKNETVSPDGIHVAGSMQGWDPAATELLDGDGDGIYEVTLALQPQGYQYKFVNGNAWGSEEGIPAACNVGGNREVTFSGDTTVTFCFGSCTWPCVQYPDSSSITFTVNMDTMTVSNDADSGGVWIMGSFTSPSWQAGAVKLTDNGSGMYSTTVKIGGAPELQYKFVSGQPNTSLAIEESGDFETMGCGIVNPVSTPNRLFNRTDVDTTLAFCWNLCAASCDSTTSVAELSFNSEVNVYPNPFTDIATVSFSEKGNYSLVVIDLTGKIVLTNTNVVSTKVNLDLGHLNNGVYILKVIDEKGAVTTKKLMLQ
jgi:hypothetical protein